MTAIGPDAPSGTAQPQTAASKLAIGAKLIAEVIGPTRQGLAVRVGEERFLLRTPPALKAAATLTLEVTARAGALEHQVQVLSSDHQALARPVSAALVSKAPVTAQTPEVSATIAEDRGIEVRARPLSPDGKAQGPSLVVRLAVDPIGGISKTGSAGAAQPTMGRQENSGAATLSPGPSSSRDGPVSAAPTVSPRTLQAPEVRQALDAPKSGSSEPGGGKVFADQHSSRGGQQQTTPSPTAAGRQGRTAPEIRTTLERWTMPANWTTKEATVIGRSSEHGQLLLQASGNLLITVEEPVDLPIGTSLQMTLLSKAAPGAPLPAAALAPDQGDLLTRLIELLEDIGRIGGTAAGGGFSQAARTSLLPKPDHQLAVSLLRLFGVQLKPDADNVDSSPSERDKASPPKVAEIRSLLAEISGMASESLDEGWRSTSIPLGSDPSQAVMIHHRDHHPAYSEGGEAEVDKPLAQRAVFDVDFSHIGRCQIDALCQDRRFDLLLRSERTLEPAHRRQITDLFHSACEIAGLTGEIGYRQGEFVEPARRSMSTLTVST